MERTRIKAMHKPSVLAGSLQETKASRLDLFGLIDSEAGALGLLLNQPPPPRNYCT